MINEDHKEEDDETYQGKGDALLMEGEEEEQEGGLSLEQKRFYCNTYTTQSDHTKRMQASPSLSSKTMPLPVARKAVPKKMRNQDFKIIGGAIANPFPHNHPRHEKGQKMKRTIAKPQKTCPPNQENCAAVANHEGLKIITQEKLAAKEMATPKATVMNKMRSEEDIVRCVMRLMRNAFEGWRHLAQQTSTAKMELVSLFSSPLVYIIYLLPDLDLMVGHISRLSCMLQEHLQPSRYKDGR